MNEWDSHKSRYYENRKACPKIVLIVYSNEERKKERAYIGVFESR